MTARRADASRTTTWADMSRAWGRQQGLPPRKVEPSKSVDNLVGVTQMAIVVL
jgi:hypothetical protein